MKVDQYFQKMPFVAILRYVKPSEVLSIADVLYKSGLTCMEVPMNSPEPCKSIALLAEKYGDDALIGAGTVISVEQVQQVADAGGKLIVMPHTDVEVIKAAKAAGLTCVSGFGTPTEAYTAIKAGVDALKLFPANLYGPSILKGIRTILPDDMPVIPTGGVDETNMLDYLRAGATAVGLGSCLYKPGDTADVVTDKLSKFLTEIKKYEGITR